MKYTKTEEQDKHYIDFGIAQYALAKVLWALYQNDIRDFWIALEDGELHVRICAEYLADIIYPPIKEKGETCGKANLKELLGLGEEHE